MVWRIAEEFIKFIKSFIMGVNRCFNIDYDVALSFAGEDRKYVEKVAKYLNFKGVNVFYDEYEKVGLWGKDLYQHLDDVYQNKSNYTIVFISEHYKNKLWSNHELRSAQARAFTENEEYILPVRFDSTEIPGIRKTIGYIDIQKMQPRKLAELILIKLDKVEPTCILPDNLTFIKEAADYTLEHNFTNEQINDIIRTIYSALYLLKEDERKFLYKLFGVCCKHDLTEDVHEEVTIVCRKLNIERDELIRYLNTLSTFDFNYSIIKKFRGSVKEGNYFETEILHFKCIHHNLQLDYINNLTIFFAFMIYGISEHVCTSCFERTFIRLDFSRLSNEPTQDFFEIIDNLLFIGDNSDDDIHDITR